MGALPREVAVTWFREEDYPALLELFEDAEEMPHTWKEWFKRAEQMEERAKAATRCVSTLIPKASPIGVCAKGKAPTVTAAKGSL
jgi:hypothetical protein